MSYLPAEDRYEGKMRYRRCGRSRLDLPLLSLGYWHNFGDERPFETQRAIARRAFDLGIVHHDLANNYGPPYGSAELNFGRLMREDFRPYRDEMVISTKAGWDMWPGPYGQGGGSRKYLLASLDQSLRRMGLDYVDVFYSHRLDGSTPLEETMGALDAAVRQGKALYVGISSYDAERTRQAAAILRDRYLDGIPDDSRAARGETFDRDWLTEEMIERLRALNDLASRRGQTLAQLALAWALRDERVTGLVIGASSVEQLEQNVDALDNLELSEEELAEIDRHTQAEVGVDLWEQARAGEW